MVSFATAFLIGSLAVATCTRSISHLRRGKQLGKMNPEAVAHTLAAVEGKWLTEAVAYSECNVTDNACQEDTIKEFKNSCQTVVGAIIQSSNGDKSVVSEYLGDICDQPELHSWKKSLCNNFATALNGVLTDDSYVNRDDLAVDTMCANFLTRGFLKQAAKDEVARAEKEKEEAIAAQEAEAKKEADEKAAAEAVEDKEREAAAKAAAAREAAQVATKLREEAKAKADEAAQKTAAASNVTETQPSVEVAVNSSASPSSVNSTSDASTVPDTSNSTTVPEVSEQAAAEVNANGTTASTTANSTQAGSDSTK
jgi:hypothetical protein